MVREKVIKAPEDGIIMAQVVGTNPDQILMVPHVVFPLVDEPMFQFVRGT